MKTINLTGLFLLLTALLATGCGAKRVAQGPLGPTYAQCPKPDWSMNPMCEGGICAVGIGKSADYGFARTKAEADGREKLAQTLSSDVRNLFERLMEENRDFAAPDASSGFAFASNTSQQLTAAIISGARPQMYYDDCVNGSVYTLMTLAPEDVTRQMKQAMSQAIRETHAVNRELKDKAVDRMNALVDERYKGAHGVSAAPMP